ncbi:diaminopropionate ammonia-lyase DplA [Hyaloraphidium curvatum]|nr:diaminopropionate ammonia-lyase DplA [Hyaloraphidium curvatum]
MAERVTLVLNAGAAPRHASYPAELIPLLDSAGFDAARAEIASWPGYAPTPLVSLPGLAAELGFSSIRYKDEAGRFGLGSFKALGGAYAVARALTRRVRELGVAEDASSAELAAGRYAEAIKSVTVTSATDGNHGRAVAWGARLFGCRAVIFIHETVSEGRRAAIASYGAQVIRVSGGYDDSVRHCFREASSHGWLVVQDTAAGEYREVPADITCGYGVLAHEICDAWTGPPPTHVLVQAGVGGLASAVCAVFWRRWAHQRPFFATLEPLRANCVQESIAAGRRIDLTGDLETVMAGLSCGEVSDLAWDVLATGTDAALAIPDELALLGMRKLADPLRGDLPVVGGECSGGAVGALAAVAAREDMRTKLGLGGGSRVLLIGTEGATDPEIYRREVGRDAESVTSQIGVIVE